MRGTVTVRAIAGMIGAHGMVRCQAQWPSRWSSPSGCRTMSMRACKLIWSASAVRRLRSSRMRSTGRLSVACGPRQASPPILAGGAS